jgi:hypothetical protein
MRSYRQQSAPEPLDSPELQADLIASVAAGLPPQFVALRHRIAPETLVGWLEAGRRRDAREPYRGFYERWAVAEATLMEEHVIAWRTGGIGALQSKEYLERRWPRIWGKDAKGDYDPLAPVQSNAEEEADMDAILSDPAAYGLLEAFARHNRLTPEERRAFAAPPEQRTD